MGFFKFVFLFFLLINACTSLDVVKLPPSLNPNEQLTLWTLNKEPVNLFDVVSKHRATVLFFWATVCPCVKRYQDRMNALYEEYAPKGVQVLAVSSNTDDSLEKLQKEKMARKVPMELLKDSHGHLANRFGATGTPAALVLDAEGRIRFRGWIDNERPLFAKNRKAFLQDALEQVLSGQEVSIPSSPMFGCPITRSLMTSP